MISTSSDPAILFDLDGPLVDTAYHHVTAWAAALKDAGIVVAIETERIFVVIRMAPLRLIGQGTMARHQRH